MNGMRTPECEMRITLDDGAQTSALLLRPPGARAAFVFAHGAGAGMTHWFMHDVAQALAERRVATLRFNFPSMDAGKKRPDAPALAHAAIRAAVRCAAHATPDLPLFAGGKSFGGRMTSQAQAVAALPVVRGLVFLGFPLHPPRKPSIGRADHLSDVRLPMLFVQGARDALAQLDLLRPICGTLGERATLHVVEAADHGFEAPVRAGRPRAQIMGEIAEVAAAWMLSRANQAAMCA